VRATLLKLFGFALLGLCLLVLKSWLEPAPENEPIALSLDRIKVEEQQWTRRWGRPPNEAERAAIIRTEADEEVLFREALKAGLHRTDPVVQMRLVQNMRFVDAGANGSSLSPQDALLEAYNLDMHKSDIVVRRRLVQVLHERLLSAASPPPPTEKELRRHIRANAAQYVSAPVISFSHVFLSPVRAGWHEGQAAELLERLRNGPIPPDDAIHLGDPLPMARHFKAATPREIAKRFGEPFGDALVEAPVGSWSGPYTTQLGQHLVWVQARTPATLRFDQLTLNKARQVLIDQRKRALVSDALAKLREDYRIGLDANADRGVPPQQDS
jgi:hypothetical protein